MKLSSLTIYIVAFCLAASIISFAFFNQAKPKLDAAAFQREYKNQLEEQANLQPKAEKRVKEATKEVDQLAAPWNLVVEKKTPAPSLAKGGVDLSVNPYQLSIDTYKFRDSIQSAVNEQVKKGGVKVITGPTVRAPADSNTVGGLLADFYNFQTFGFPVVIFDFGTITVQGSYEQIMANVRAYRDMKGYLAVADGLRLEGTNVLTGSYSLSVVGFLRGDKLFPAVPEAAATAVGNPFGGGAAFGGGRPFGPTGAAGAGRGRPAGGAGGGAAAGGD